jgi:heterotetrameric sarcosine oxidase delta subunit
MLLITCPWCGPRYESEFSYGGEAGLIRPKDPAALSDEEWGDYLYMRENKRGPHVEQWCHAAGCRRWFNVSRDTATNQIKGVSRIGESMLGGNTDAG